MHRSVLLGSAMALMLSGCNGERDLPQAYRDLEVPRERLDSAEARERGRTLYLRHCTLCHGERADGRGVRREGLSAPPRDFTDPGWRRRTSARRVYHAIREGSRGTPMPGWKSLSEPETWDLVAYLLAAGERP